MKTSNSTLELKSHFVKFLQDQKMQQLYKFFEEFFLHILFEKKQALV